VESGVKILALDIATNTGICVGAPGANPKAWSVNLGQAPEARRLSNALRMAHGLIETHKPDLIVVEAAIGGKNASAYLTKLLGCVEGCAYNRGVNLTSVYPATVRKHFMGKAKTSRDFPHLKPAKAKLAIKEEIAQRCRLLGWDVPDLDAADAAATWDWACATQVKGYQAKPTGGLF
jgi:Holliday junction resolvasome RuvABC endonuclease subunit